MPQLGVNIDHIATLRQARREFDPDPILAAQIAENAGADSIVAHLREDRRHIQENDILLLKKKVKTCLNLEMSLNHNIVDIACRVKPAQVTLVPEKRSEITTEGGLDVIKNIKRIISATHKLKNESIKVSVFIDPLKNQIKNAHKAGINIIEIHTGKYDLVSAAAARLEELKKIREMTKYAISLGITVNAGHGLKYHNTPAIAKIKGMHELNIGHSIIARAVFVGLHQAVKEMKALVK